MFMKHGKDDKSVCSHIVVACAKKSIWEVIILNNAQVYV